MCHRFRMDQRVSEQLDKILALADSSHDGEALGAVRKARQILSKGGLSFGDLAMAAEMPRGRRSLPFPFSSGQQSRLEGHIFNLRSRLNAMQMEVERQKMQAQFWHDRANELEQNLRLQSAETERWRQLAKETVDKLWNMGEEIYENEDKAMPGDSPSTLSPLKTRKHS